MYDVGPGFQSLSFAEIFVLFILSGRLAWKPLFMNLNDYLSEKGQAPKGTTKDWLFFCRLEVKSGNLWAGDPNLPNADDGLVVQVPVGTYVVEGIGMPFGTDRVVSRLRVRLESATDLKPGKELGETGTDSGAIGVCDLTPFEEAYKIDGGADKIQEVIDACRESHGILRFPDFTECIMPFVATGSDGNGPVIEVLSAQKLVGIELPFMDENFEAYEA